ncbi:hypothetical protein VNO78_08317 [Psophocarpus tetragonolobus]|uniref:Uncharacterized protein n=1 Tax=Psophocarpus tetragonolobus TaxID=3891 RepID=A0AAN9XSH9_PSOTE
MENVRRLANALTYNFSYKSYAKVVAKLAKAYVGKVRIKGSSYAMQHKLHQEGVYGIKVVGSIGHKKWSLIGLEEVAANTHKAQRVVRVWKEAQRRSLDESELCNLTRRKVILITSSRYSVAQAIATSMATQINLQKYQPCSSKA